ncbi:MAG: DUF3558 domain-containing protein [Mycobacterium sp.]|nr:DUF3558 domain-containing protein [Mycobacterium sp.]
MRARILAVLGVLAAGTLLAGCSGSGNATTTNNGGGTPSSSAAGSSGSGSGGAPTVTHVIDPGSLAKQPCKLLSTSQLQAIHIKATHVANDAQGYGCQWDDGPDNTSIEYVFYPQFSLSYFYDHRSDYQSKGYFQPTTLASQPAVYENDQGDDRSQGNCNIAVGLSDTTAIEMDYSGHAALNETVGSQGCTRLTQAASEVVQALQANGGK